MLSDVFVRWWASRLGDSARELFVIVSILLNPRTDPFAPCSIHQAVSEQLDTEHLQGVTSVVMVGGFSGSVHVQVSL